MPKTKKRVVEKNLNAHVDQENRAYREIIRLCLEADRGTRDEKSDS